MGLTQAYDVRTCIIMAKIYVPFLALPSSPLPCAVVKNDGISTTSSSSSSHLGIILGTVFGFVGGAALGVIGMAIFFNRKKYVWNKYLGNGEEEAVRSEKEGKEVSFGLLQESLSLSVYI